MSKFFKVPWTLIANTNPSSNYFLQTNGSGQLSWVVGPSGTVKGTGAATTTSDGGK